MRHDSSRSDGTPTTRTGETTPRFHLSVTRRQWMGLAVSGGSLGALAWLTRAAASDPRRVAGVGETPMVMYASSGCLCCHKKLAHLESNGFRVTTQFLPDVGIKKDALGVPTALRSCHTAEVGNYVIEGHVPAGVIKRFLAEGSTDIGLAAPGMPAGSPGMEGILKDPFDIIAFARNGDTRTYARA